MVTENKLGRLVGLMMLLSMATGIVGFFVVLPPAFDDPGYLVNAAANAGSVRAGAMLVLVPAALMLCIVLAGWPVWRRNGECLPLALLALAATGLAVTVIEQGMLLAMLSLSQAHAAASAPQQALFDAAQVFAGSARYWIHYLTLFLSGVASLTLYALLFRSRLLPRALPAFGMAAVALHLVAILLHVAGQPFNFTLVAPAGASQLATGCLLLALGFRARQGGAQRTVAQA
ncbi:DUF4386 domain-containing protein [Pseudoduganella sp. SL102]|uniref:DUF4386 domain-containing protein n=1 Tax=Pseudoduganella sp. SL102 TaxID=2995154 RepID=UPI00248B000F|nr:DUF4386 domain-containing protein [Pseudoduganella sp. SL102]WBS04663.1 DUF4386 domain-containing protein [Pseudoduganella sp. SL102]